ncbi:MAG: acetyltransferase [Marmoricola sp.]|nr:acetyltransferase [Marmoricola sp.]
MSIGVRAMNDGESIESLNVGNPHAWVAARWREIDTPEVPISWFVGLLDDRPVGWAAAAPFPFAQGGLGKALIQVLAPSRRRGVGAALRETVEEVVRAAGLPGVQASHDTQDPDAVAAVATWGLCEVARHQESVLDLTAIDRVAFTLQAATAGVELAVIPDSRDMSETDWQRLHTFVEARHREAPDSADGGGDLPYRTFREAMSEPWMVALASEHGRWIGCACVLRRSGTPDVANTAFTGVVRDARGRGIATALKCHQSIVMADHGLARLYTQTMDGNEPILAANRTLGFRIVGEYADVVVRF